MGILSTLQTFQQLVYHLESVISVNCIISVLPVMGNVCHLYWFTFCSSFSFLACLVRVTVGLCIVN